MARAEGQLSKQMAAQMDTLNVTKRMRPLPFIAMVVVAADFNFFQNISRRCGCSMSLPEL